MSNKSNKALPSTKFAKIYERTTAQSTKVVELEAKGWIAVTEPEDTFNGAIMMEAPDNHYFILPDGSVKLEY